MCFESITTHDGIPDPLLRYQVYTLYRRLRLGNGADHRQFDINLLHMPPDVQPYQRRWHVTKDGLICVLQGELVLVTDTGEDVLRTWDCVKFQAESLDDNHLQNRSNAEAIVLEIGASSGVDAVNYPDINLAAYVGRLDAYIRMISAITTLPTAPEIEPQVADNSRS